MDRGHPAVDGSTSRTYHTCSHFLPVIVEMKSTAHARPIFRHPWDGIYFKLSVVVHSNSDWWKIRETDCMGWWTAVSQINLAFSDPAELTIVSADWPPFQTLVVILPPSRMLVGCQLRAEAPNASLWEQWCLGKWQFWPRWILHLGQVSILTKIHFAGIFISYEYASKMSAPGKFCVN